MINLNFLFKRVLDIFISLFLIITLSPLLFLISLLIFLEIKENPFFIQLRNGKNLKKFKIFKFKTMYKSEDGIKNFTQVKKFDTRVTIIGNFLRKNSIDELPQIFNVLLGNMSLVGPRPHPIALDKKFEKLIENYNDRYNVFPGITGLAQVSGFRGETDSIDKMRNRVLCDIKYGENINLFSDLIIIMKTFLVVFKGI
tara:strand:+ start:20118 stop:20711 length:594 start_codon:yes stop_codon:yes gene_type:complete